MLFRSTVPQIWIGDRHVGGCDDLHDLDREGRLDALLAEERLHVIQRHAHARPQAQERADLLAELSATARREGMSILPVREGRPEPLVAAWHRSALPALEAAAARNGSFQEVVVELVAGGRARLHSLDPAGASLLANVNTPSDFARLAAPAAG